MPFPVLINRDYTRLWCGQAASSLGAAVFSTTLVLWVATVLAEGQTWAPLAVSGVLLATGAAVLFVGPLAGVFVDRWDKRSTMLRSEAFRGGVVAVLAFVSFVPTGALPVAVWLAVVYAALLLLHSANQFFSPARFAVVADLVSGDADRARAAGIAQATSQTAWIVGPPLAAPLFFTVGFQWALLFNTLTCVMSFLAIRSIAPPTAGRAPGAAESAGEAGQAESAGAGAGLLREFAAGLRFFARSRFLVALLVLATIGQFGIGALNTLNVFFTTDNLGASAELYGWLGMAMGLGGITGALCAGRVVQWIGARRTAWIALLVSGTLLVVYSRQTGFAAGVMLIFLFTVPLTMLNTAMAPLLLNAAPAELRGRVVAVFYPVTQLALMLAAVLSGWLAGSLLKDLGVAFAGMRFGTIDTIFAVSGVIVLAAGVYARFALPAAGDEAVPAETVKETAPETAPETSRRS